MYDHRLYQQISSVINQKEGIDIAGNDNLFYNRLLANAGEIHTLYNALYGTHARGEAAFAQLLKVIVSGYADRAPALKQRDLAKAEKGQWYLSNTIAGMSLYVDRFCGKIKNLEGKLDYFEELGINFLHLMPLFESPANESDGGYAVSNFKKIDKRFGTLGDLRQVQRQMQGRDMFMMLDIVMNHTSRRHEWAEKACAGDAYYQDFFYFFDDHTIPAQYEEYMPEIFPESSPGNFSYLAECDKWVMTVFHNYQWDLNYTNPHVLAAMLDVVFFHANLGVDILRVDAPAFIWKQIGTACQNLPQAHQLLQLVKLCIEISAPGMALLGEAIVAPQEIMKYFGTGRYLAKECDFAYNATQMAVQWDALATGDTSIMRAVQPELLKKPSGSSWITYTRCHDDIGLGYNDETIAEAGFDPYLHRDYIKNYYSGVFPGSPATGALFSSNSKTGDARISGTLASLCGLEKAIADGDEAEIKLAIKKIMLMQAQSFFIGGVPMLFYGDEVGYTNDYSYLDDAGKSYDNRWMHRPVIDWHKTEKITQTGTIEQLIFSETKRLLHLRKKEDAFTDHKNLQWLDAGNRQIALFVRSAPSKKIYCIFNFGSESIRLPASVIPSAGNETTKIYDLADECYCTENDAGFLSLNGYSFKLLEIV